MASTRPASRTVTAAFCQARLHPAPGRSNCGHHRGVEHVPRDAAKLDFGRRFESNCPLRPDWSCSPTSSWPLASPLEAYGPETLCPSDPDLSRLGLSSQVHCIRHLQRKMGARVSRFSPVVHLEGIRGPIMIHFSRARTIVVLLLVASASPPGAKTLIDDFQPIPTVGKLSTTLWGAAAVGPRDPSNGIEDPDTAVQTSQSMRCE